MTREEQLELGSDIGCGEIDGFVAKELFFHLGEFLLGGINFTEDQGDLFGD